MAMYQEDNIRNIQAAVPDASGLAQATANVGRANAGMIEALGGAVSTGIKMKAEYDLRSAQQEAEGIQDEFLTSGIAAEQAQRTLPQVQQNITDIMDQGPPSPEEQAVIDDMKGQVARLKDAAASGMSNVAYESRVNSLTKKYIARYPGLSDKIRQIVGASTGLGGADRWAAQQYVAERFKAQQGGDGEGGKMQMRLIENSVKAIAAETGMLETEVFSVMQTDPDRYRQLERQATERRSLRVQTDVAKNATENMAASNNLTAPEARTAVTAMYSGMAGQGLITNITTQMAEGRFQGFLDAARKGTLNSEQLQAETTIFTQGISRMLDNAYAESIRTLNDLRQRYPFDTATYNDLKQGIKDQYDADKTLWGNENALVAMAGAMAKYSQQGYQKTYDAYRLAVEEMRTYGPQTIQNFLLNPKVLEQQQPEVFNALTDVFKRIDNFRGQLSGSTAAKADEISFTVKTAESTGVASGSPDATPENKKTAREVVATRGEQALAKAVEGGTLSFQESNLLRSAFDVRVTNGNPTTFNKAADRIKKQLAQAPEDIKNSVMETVSKGTVQNVTAINSLLDGIEAKYGVRPTIGINSAGMLLAGMPQMSGAPSAEKAAKARAAIEEFNNQGVPLLMNLVNGRYVVDERSKRDVGVEYSNIINNRVPYTGFFSMEAQPTENIFPAGSLKKESSLRGAIGDVMNFQFSPNEKAEIRKVMMDALKRTDLTAEARRELEANLEFLK